MGQRKLFILSEVLGYINGIQLATFGLLFDRTLIYFQEILKTLASVIRLFLCQRCLIGVKEHIYKSGMSWRYRLIVENVHYF